MNYMDRSRKENRNKYFIAGLLDSILAITGLLLIMISLSAFDLAENVAVPFSWMLAGFFIMIFAYRNIIIMEGGDEEDEET